MGMMERLLRLMAEKKASDIYLSASSPALIKIDGVCVPINNQLLSPDTPRALLAEVVKPQDMETLQETGELNIAVPLQLGNHGRKPEAARQIRAGQACAGV